MFALLMLCLCVILHTMWSGKSLQFLCILCLFAIGMMFVNKIIGSVYVGLSESRLCVFLELCLVFCGQSC